eukprot:TRINITY_DN3716_c0_g1_i11.p2 TRINITY_DN3716_c0_g1~~TRINITY_DN3716_c0_g1_i11.p2  ORF type:complete len:113 (+),score=15.74 TRINITY_DN3716_c0_g1_i11:65-403(+)
MCIRDRYYADTQFWMMNLCNYMIRELCTREAVGWPPFNTKAIFTLNTCCSHPLNMLIIHFNNSFFRIGFGENFLKLFDWSQYPTPALTKIPFGSRDTLQMIKDRLIRLVLGL